MQYIKLRFEKLYENKKQTKKLVFPLEKIQYTFKKIHYYNYGGDFYWKKPSKLSYEASWIFRDKIKKKGE